MIKSVGILRLMVGVIKSVFRNPVGDQAKRSRTNIDDAEKKIARQAKKERTF